MKTEIITITSHQLRTPLTAIKGNLEMILEDVKGLSKEQRNILSEAYIDSERIIGLINNLMDVSKLENNGFKLEFSPVQLNDLLVRVVKDFQPFAELSRVTLTYQPPAADLPPVNIDSARIKQVIKILIDNAIKYSRINNQGRVDVRLEKDEAGGFLKLAVRDNGIGVPEKEQENIFKKYSRGSNVSRLDPNGGIGLGLFIAKSIIDRHKGRIWFESEKKKGTTFYVDLFL